MKAVADVFKTGDKVTVKAGTHWSVNQCMDVEMEEQQGVISNAPHSGPTIFVIIDGWHEICTLLTLIEHK